MISIVTPCYNEELYLKSAAKTSLDELSKNQNCSFSWKASSLYGARISDLRNRLIRSSNQIHQKLDPAISHFLLLDSDIKFTAGHIQQLLNQNLDIVSGAYLSRSNPKNYEAWFLSPAGINTQYVQIEGTSGLHKIDGGTGLGFMLVKRTAFEKMFYPWFSEYISTMIVKVETMFGTDLIESAETLSEDGFFALNARRSGLDIYLDCDCRVEHLI